MGRVVAKHRVGRLLGRGGFAKCYSFTDCESGKVLACKVIDRASLQKSKTLQKLHSEIAIHKRMKHKNIVSFVRTFQDDWFVYILLEKCSNQTLMEVAKARRRFTVPETQFIMIQSLSAMQYMHENNVIHRDLKLGNMMMDDDMNVKIGDFGLAAELSYDGERKRTICGTPNYIAPEILEGARDGHSFEADVWSLGVILYTLLVGEPPFQTPDVKTTYSRIKQCRYTFPATVEISEAGKNLIHRILQSRPDRRPTLMDIRTDPFFKTPTPPTTAPLTLFPDHLRRQRERDAAVLEAVVINGATANGLKERDENAPVSKRAAGKESPRRVPSPREVPAVFSARSTNQAAPERQALSARQRTGSLPTSFVPGGPQRPAPTVGGWCSDKKSDDVPKMSSKAAKVEDEEERHHLTALHDKLHQTLIGEAVEEDATSLPAPTAWVTDYADFSSKYGLAYRMNSGHTGVHYNDSTKMVWEPVTNRVEYYARIKETIDGVVHAQDSRSSFHMDTFPENLNKKVTLIKYFKSYLSKAKGKKDGVEVVSCTPYTATAPTLLTEPHMVSDMVYVKRWLITPQAMIFRLSNRTIQVCFFDNVEVILSSESKIVSFTEATGRRRTIPLSAVAAQSEEIASRLKYTKDILHKLINNKEL